MFWRREPDARELDPEVLGGEHSAVGVPAHAFAFHHQEARHARAMDVRVEDADRLPALSEDARDVHGDRALADSALSARDRQYPLCVRCPRSHQRHPLKEPGFGRGVTEYSTTPTVATRVFLSSAKTLPEKSMLPPPKADSSS